MVLELAKTRKCYEKVHVVDMNQLPLPYPDDSFDAVTCVGTVTYLEPAVLGKFVRITRSGRGLVCYTN
jgi:ubiquinone/menaquinone biosynthesis C-methylase UbiE